MNEPIADAVRGILDGHIVLSRQLAAAGHYPAIDVLHSVSRLASALSTQTQLQQTRKIRHALSLYEQSKDLIALGAYAAGSNPQLDSAISAQRDLNDFLRQDVAANGQLPETLDRLAKLAGVLA